MKKSKKIILRLIPVLLLVVVVLNSSVFGFSNFDPSQGNLDTVGDGSYSTVVNDTVNKVWGSVTLILQVLAIAAIVFAGVRYMFASADQKADIKKSMIILVVGAVLVFGASTIVQFIVNVTNDVTNTTP